MGKIHLEKKMATHSSKSPGQRRLAGYGPWGLTSSTRLAAQTVKRLPEVRETRIRSLGWEDPLEKEMATHSSILAWKITWTEEPGRLQSMGSQRVGHD